MLDTSFRQQIKKLIQSEVVPAMGCTEPVAVSLNCAVARERLGEVPVKVTVELSGNMLKNAMGVGIPGTGMRGLPIAIALGTLIGRPEKKLEVLADVCPEAVERAKEWLAKADLRIVHDPSAPDILYIHTVMTAPDGRTAEATTVHGHANILPEGRTAAACPGQGAPSEPAADMPELTMATVWDYADTTPLDELRFILESKEINENISHQGLDEEWGHGLGRMLHRSESSDSMLNMILAATAAACDARMGGAPTAVMSNSGSGNQGITATLPVTTYAARCRATEEQTIRALVLSHLTVIYIKQSLGRLSALCGCVVASTGSACGIARLMGGGYKEVCSAAKNMIANLTGMICDGAKPGCALKVTGGVSMAVMSALMAIDGRCVTSQEGIIDDDVDRCIRNLTTIGRDGMRETDRLILKIMTSK